MPSAASANNAPCVARPRAAVSGDKARVIVNTPDLPRITRRRKPFANCAALVVSAVAALLLFDLTPPPGPRLDPDSAAYRGAAEALTRGRAVRARSADCRALETATT